MDREGSIPPGLAAGLIVLVMVIGALAYSAGRFGRRLDKPAHAPASELPAPAAPVPAVGEIIPTPADLPPTVTPSVPVLIEKSERSFRIFREKSSQIVVPLPPGPAQPVRPTAFPGIRPEEPTPRRQIAVEFQATPHPSPTPTAPALEQQEEEQEPAPEETPEAIQPTPRAQPGGSPVSI